MVIKNSSDSLLHHTRIHIQLRMVFTASIYCIFSAGVLLRRMNMRSMSVCGAIFRIVWLAMWSTTTTEKQLLMKKVTFPIRFFFSISDQGVEVEQRKKLIQAFTAKWAQVTYIFHLFAGALTVHMGWYTNTLSHRHIPTINRLHSLESFFKRTAIKSRNNNIESSSTTTKRINVNKTRILLYVYWDCIKVL